MRLLAQCLLPEFRGNLRITGIIQLKFIARSAIPIRVQTADGMIGVGNTAHIFRIDDAVAHMHPGDLADYQSACFEIQFGV